MKQRIRKKMIFEGLGFPILLTNVPLIKIRGEWVPDIRYNNLQNTVLVHLCHKKMPLTGNEIKFIRKYFSLTTKDFAKLFGYTHSAVLKWENQGNHIARIAPTTEVYLRFFILEHLHQRSSDFKELYKEISIPHLAEYLKKSTIYEYTPLYIDACKELLVA